MTRRRWARVLGAVLLGGMGLAWRAGADGGISLCTVPPCRLLDTRNVKGPYGGPVLFTGIPRALQVTGRCGVPANAVAVVLNVAAVSPGIYTLTVGSDSRDATEPYSFRLTPQ